MDALVVDMDVDMDVEVDVDVDSDVDVVHTCPELITIIDASFLKIKSKKKIILQKYDWCTYFVDY